MLKILKWILKGSAALLFVLVSAGAVLAISLLVEHHFRTELPDPSGPFLVGRTTRLWQSARSSADSASGEAHREMVFAWIWYPATGEGVRAPVDDYFPPSWRAAMEGSESAVIGALFERDLAKVSIHSLRDPPVSPSQSSYPVVIFRGGLSTQSLEYSTLSEDLASHGYIVVGIDAPFRTHVFVMPDGRIFHRTDENNPEMASPEDAMQHIFPRLVSEWVADVGFALDNLKLINESDGADLLKGKLDLSRAGVVGHSLGGAVAVQFCSSDPRCKVGIDIDGLVLDIPQSDRKAAPLLFLMGDHADESAPEDREIAAKLQGVFRSLDPGSRTWLDIRGANHFNFSDGAVVKSHIVMSILRLLGVVKMDGQRQLAITAACIHPYLDKHVGVPIPELARQTCEDLYPEVVVRH